MNTPYAVGIGPAMQVLVATNQRAGRMSRARRAAGQSGFSLLEVLIALLIAGLALTTAFRAASESMTATASAARYQEALSRARSHLDGLAANLVAGEREGNDGGGFHWRVAVRPIDSTGKRDAADRPLSSSDTLVVTLYATSVWISWKEGQQTRSLRLDSARLLTSGPG